MARQRKTALPMHDPVEEFMLYFWMLFIFASIILLAMAWQVHENFLVVSHFFESLTFSNPIIVNYLKGNTMVIGGVFAIYLMTIAVCKVKKGIFSESEQMTRVWSGVFVYRIFTMVVLTPFIIYLADKIIPGNDSLRQLWISLLLASQILLMYPFVIEKTKQDHALKGNYFFTAAWTGVLLTLIGVSIFIKPFWEPVIIILISSIVLPSSEKMLKRYMQSIQNYDAIKTVNDMNDEFLYRAQKGETQYPFEEKSSGKNPSSLPYVFYSLDSLGYMLVAGAFASLVFSWIYQANIITAFYIHTTLILCALQLWIASNKFPPRVNIRTGDGWVEGVFLLEHSEKKILIMSENGRHFFNPGDISEIHIPLKTRHPKNSPKNTK